jgi:hypothetical protein
MSIISSCPLSLPIELTPSFYQYASHYTWPSNGARTQRFRARWPDGAMNTEFFDSNTPPPQAIAIVSPSVGNYRDIWTTPAKKELQIKKEDYESLPPFHFILQKTHHSFKLTPSPSLCLLKNHQS